MHNTHESALSPFKHRTFTIMWLAALISNIGTWMHSVGASWLMTSLSPTPLTVSLVQTATTLPVFLFALPAGALADIFNRRTLLLLTNLFMLAAALIFAILVWVELVTAELLLLFAFLLGTGAAFMAPAWQAIIPGMVPKEDLPQAITLGGISINLSRAIGPALAGVLIGAYGMALPFVANAISFIIIITVLLWWKYQTPAANLALPPERVVSAMRAGVRYAWHSRPLKHTMWHVMGFMFFANAVWGLLPIISKDQLSGDAAFFGLLMGAVGVGAITGAFLLPRFKIRLNANQLVAIGSTGTALMAGYFAIGNDQELAVLAGFIFGVGWIMVLATVNVSAQQSLPDWVRGRGLAVFLMVFFGSMSLGAAFWGWLAEITSIMHALLAAAAGAIVFIAFSYRLKLQQGQYLDFTPSLHWPEPVIHEKVVHDAGPVIIQIKYNVVERDREAFLQAIYRLKAARQRDGGYNWGVYEDVEGQGCFVEHFTEESWVEHMRHHERVTHADKALQEAVLVFHQKRSAPEVRHLIAAYPSGKSDLKGSKTQ
ncbi:MFS transporter [uncultured Nitrosomonas sp.]|uniref:MFS transporter n=1 Tax=uncultured Nitrosomonas sp. TaxID=156424 RepID=UPI0025D401D3|nr:MFS transporter [uncultured Nitrosomonas sp.]